MTAIYKADGKVFVQQSIAFPFFLVINVLPCHTNNLMGTI
jgi:hypothetical protein